ncbi:hypothetical protein [Chryseobacterium defluvii]|uniref:LPXTG-motif cell wall-anchored protein n=1 Tax=Chryseobacterium defluvii TaxID=160396 RepID=A0A495SA01_9FLAO|nr:hypothetical protein [Chryseobacterium defluvii]RKS96715.1 hypothetical protein BCF58_3147 [Chryseobacterium defluvii]
METIALLKTKGNKLMVYLLTVFFSAMAFAQEKVGEAQTSENTTSTKTTTTTEWYANPLYLIIGAAVLIIIVAFLTRGRNKE